MVDEKARAQARPDWAPDNVDTDVASVARLYDYLLGGEHNFAVDRAAAHQLLAAEPAARYLARLNRALLRWTVTVMAQGGIRQFLDLGSGIPTSPSVHEVARAHQPDAATVYVDIDPVAIAHARMVLRTQPRARVIRADLHDPAAVLAGARETGLLDFSEPIGVTIFAVLHYINDTDEAASIIRAVRDAAAPGSYLGLAQLTRDEDDDAPGDTISQRVGASTQASLRPRTSAEVRTFFDGFDLLEPGLVPLGATLPLVPLPGFDPAETGLVVPPVADGASERPSGVIGIGRKR